MAFAPGVRGTYGPLARAVQSVIEPLEQRTLLSVTLEDGILTIAGSGADDSVTVRPLGADGFKVNEDGTVHRFSNDDVRRIVFEGGAGDDVLRVKNIRGRVNVPIVARGGAGDDVLRGGHGDDRFFGEGGNDVLLSGSGDNLLHGGAGHDTLLGGDAVDKIFGGDGDDVIGKTHGKGKVRPGAGNDRTSKVTGHFPPIETYTPDPTGIQPFQQRNAYGFGSLDNEDYDNLGQGTAIAIVGAYDVPEARADVNRFSREFGLPKMSKKTLQIVNMAPKRRRLFDEGWNSEAMLDLQWAHAIAPKARIIMVQAATNADGDMFSAVTKATRLLNKKYGGGVVSMSWGAYFDEEQDRVYERTFRGSDTRFVSFIASSGDIGGISAYPSFSPNVVSVGGTTLYLDQWGNRVTGVESVGEDPRTALDVWGNDFPRRNGCGDELPDEVTGDFDRGIIPGGERGWWEGSGGLSNIFDLPRFQDDRNILPEGPGATRGVPDVAWNGDPSTGVSVFNSIGAGGESGWATVGGTSAGAPQFAALVALANQLRIEKGNNPIGSTLIDHIYRLGGRGGDAYFNDIYRQGSGPLPDPLPDCDMDVGWVLPADPGFDLSTGWGTPNAQSLIPALAGRKVPLTTGELRMSGTFSQDLGIGGNAFEWVTFTGRTRAVGYGTVIFPSMTAMTSFRVTTPSGGGPQPVETNLFVVDFYGQDEIDGRADRNDWLIDFQAGQIIEQRLNQGSGVPIHLFKEGNSITGQGFITVTQIEIDDDLNGQVGDDELIVRTVPIRFVGSVNKRGKVRGEFYGINASGERLKRVNDPNNNFEQLVVSGTFRM